jgi:2-dehydro-3-deoxygalactonokinase
MAGLPNGEMTSKLGAFISCDWGSTSFRLRIVEMGTRRIIAEQQTVDGIKTFAALPPANRSTAMASLLAERLALWPDADPKLAIAISGMASSNVGWEELPYVSAPFPLDGSRCGLKWIAFPDRQGSRRKALLISGVRTTDDIMRGEECVLVGAHTLRGSVTQLEGPTLALLAGTHPKHAVISDSSLISFRTHLTGELFDALASTTLLSASIDRSTAGNTPDIDQFRAGVAMTRERGFSGSLFQVRARGILHSSPKPANTWFLSGLLVGAELERLATNPTPGRLLLIGDPLRITLYRQALRELAVNHDPADSAAVDLSQAVIAGQEVLLRRAQAMSEA